jgi:hypothetical protein
MILDPGEIHAGEGREKVERALARFSVEEARDEAAFDEGYRALDAEFGPRAELERREVLATWFAGPRTPPPGWWSGPWARGDGGAIRCRYHLLLGRDEAGRLAGARDCFVSTETVAPGRARCVVLLSHSLVLPPYRRTGLAALLRAAPVALARRAAAEAGVAPEAAEVVLIAEMEPASPEDKGTVVRLLAYGRAGFRVIPPAIFPYAQPDFRDLTALGAQAVPLPLLMVVRQVGEEARLEMPRARVEACLRQVQSVHACDSQPEDIAPIRDHALRALSAFEGDPVPLLRLPEGRGEIHALGPLVRSAVLPLYPAAWRRGAIGDPAAEAAALAAAWGEGRRE